MLHVYYRASDSDKPEVRPEYFSKALSLRNFFRSLTKLDPETFTFTMFYDGNNYEELKKIVDENKGEFVQLNKLGNSESFWHVFQYALKQGSEDWVYFVEDDYLHKEEAITKLVNCIEDIPKADYITLFDHPVRYAKDYHFGLDVPHRVNTIFISRDHHWRSQESTCMTFAAKVAILKEDEDIFYQYIKKVNVPEDRELFKRLQGLMGYEDGSPFRLLIGPMPSLITHCHIPWMAPLVNWEEVAKNS